VKAEVLWPSISLIALIGIPAASVKARSPVIWVNLGTDFKLPWPF
jgi:hypothetical protein